MDKHQFSLLQTRALTLLSEREKAADLTIVHVMTDLVPSTKAHVFKFFAAEKGTPNDPRYEIVLNENGELLDPAILSKQEGIELFVRRDLVVDRRRLRELGVSEALITIKPTENDLTLNPGDHQEESLTVSIPKSASVQKLDVYLLADTTGSMGPVLTAVRMSADAILTALDGMGLDVAFGVGNYKDFPNPSGASPFQHQVSPTTDLVTVRAAINAWVASGGMDIPEGQLFALDQLAEDQEGAIGWRFGAKQIIVWFGDAPGHDRVCEAISGLDHDITEGRVLGALSRQAITVIAISTVTGPGLDADPKVDATDYVDACGVPEGFAGQATRLTDATGGTFLTDIEPTAIVNAIVDALTDAVLIINDVHLDSTDVTRDFVTAITPRRVGPISTTMDQVIQFDVQFTGVTPCTDEPQVFEGAIAVVVDGDVKTFKSLRVTVPACKRYVEIKDSPGATVSRKNIGPNSTNEISVFVRGMDDNLLRCFNTGNPEDVANWTWEDRGRPSGARVNDSPFTIASDHLAFYPYHDFIHAFVKGDDGHLYEEFWNGTGWANWVDHNQPHWQSTVVASPTVITYRGAGYEEGGLIDEGVWWSDADDQVAAFVWGSDGQLHRHRDTWHHNGRLLNQADVGSVAGVAREHSRLYVFVVGNDNRLYVNISLDGRANNWAWLVLGQPNVNTGVVWFRRPGIEWFFFDGHNQLYTFVTGTDGHLWVHRWRGLGPILAGGFDLGSWHDLGTPSSGATVSSAAGVIRYKHAGNDQLYAFVRGSDNRLYTRYWDAGNSSWVWRDLGQPANAAVRSDPAVVTYKHANQDPFYVFIRGNDDYLHMCHLDSGITNWQWKELSEE